ncbi:acyl-CoA synthetase MbcS [Jeotgalibacillus soli]|uniref:Acyl--CoA ligase n=1 Tax=Jeotgalibacillus soli TaxID=889306 RepID=A0A0C2VIM6_9BACL|nr:acyl--CoA ligase [Jeotgalibacillus soli]KIL43858.1 acyl--CoA ligase [Jeotgalibacillus soli]
MKREDLLAPVQYNVIEEIEKYTGQQRTALYWEDEAGNTKEITYDQLLSNVNKIGNVFKHAGLNQGDVVLIMIPRLIEAYEVYLAALKIGLVVIPSSEMLRPKDIIYRLTHGEVRAVVSFAPFISQFDHIDEMKNLHKFIIGANYDGWVNIEEAMSEETNLLQAAATRQDDMAFLSYTSGTTGLPKGVVHTHGWAYAHLRTTAPNWLGIQDGDVVWATAAPGWQKWIWSPFLSVLGSGAAGLVYTGKFDPETYLHLLKKYQVNVLCCTPTEYRIMAKVNELEKFDLSSLRNAVSAGEPLNREVIETFQRYFNINVRDGYGQTENTLLVGIMNGMELRPGSMGKPTPGNRVEIIDDEGQPCEPGVVGEIAVHVDTPALFKAYFKDPERTSMQFRGEYYITGDRAKKDEDGYFWFEGRADDIIISSGYTIGPFEVEDALIKHPLVRECAVVASPDEIRGNVVKAFVILREESRDKNEELVTVLQEHVKQLTAPYKYPRKIEFVQELPKTPSGKIRRVELRKKEQENSSLL